VGEREGDFMDNFIRSENFDPAAKKFNLLFTRMLTLSVRKILHPGSLMSIKTKEPRYGRRKRKRKRKRKQSVNGVLPCLRCRSLLAAPVASSAARILSSEGRVVIESH
jgi:hypothetical protein